ncbi:MAG: transcriptional repressor [Hyphomicrobiaceae bacterium TMED74]|nr:transcriptional repressor [Filomicrobium sp.]RPG43059.1 MAG: transcriptional repressor [Hyphomicrobiaceae bacterium TMED74]
MATQKLTKNQGVVLEALRESAGPMSAYQILDVESVREKGLKAPLTIYRALDKLVEVGLVHRIETLNAFVSCDQEHHTEPPAFMICEECKRIIEVGTRSIQRTVLKQAEEQGFQVNQMHVEVSGRCRKCAN